MLEVEEIFTQSFILNQNHLQPAFPTPFRRIAMARWRIRDESPVGWTGVGCKGGPHLIGGSAYPSQV